MSTTFHRPFRAPKPEDDPEQQSREAANRQLCNLLNQKERHHRQNMASQEALSAQIDERQHRTDIGLGEVLKMMMLSEDIRKGEHEDVVGLLSSILQELQGCDFLRIPEEERQYTADPDEQP